MQANLDDIIKATPRTGLDQYLIAVGFKTPFKFKDMNASMYVDADLERMLCLCCRHHVIHEN